MKFYIKQKIFSWSDTFYIRDEYGFDRYYAEGEIFSLVHKLHIIDLMGGNREVALIKEHFTFFLAQYTIEIQNAVYNLSQELALFRLSFFIDGLPWQIEGDFFEHEYTITSGSNTIMEMSKVWFAWGDSYEIEIFRPENELLGLCIALAIDCVLCRRNNS